MKDIQVIDNFLEPEYIEKVRLYVEKHLSDPMWNTNLSWGGDIRISSTQVSCFSLLKNKQLCNHVSKKYKLLYPELKNKKLVSYSFYIWHKLSYIPFHDDGGKFLSSTIYLNEEWNKNFGGLFLYEKDNEIKCIYPSFNRCVVNTNKLSHGTSLTSIDAPYRTTLQIFFK